LGWLFHYQLQDEILLDDWQNKPNNNMQPMQTSKLPTNNFTKAFAIYNSIYKGHLQNWIAMLECRWVQEPYNQKEKEKSKVEKKKTILNKARNIF